MISFRHSFSSVSTILQVVCAVFILFCLPFRAYSEERHLLIINSYHEMAPWTQEMMTPITLQLAQRDDIRVSMLHLRNGVPDAKMEEGMFRRFDDQNPDYLVLIGSMSFMLRDRIVREWGDVPMLLIAETDEYGPRDYYSTGRMSAAMEDSLRPMAELRDRYNFTLVEMPDLYRQTIDMMMRMLPQMKRLVFSADGSRHSRHLNYLIRAYMAEKYPHCAYECSLGDEEYEKHLQGDRTTRDSLTGLLLCTWFYEPANIYGYPRFMLGDTYLEHNSSQPVFALRSTYLQDGITGGYFPDPTQIRKAISNTFKKMLEGHSMRDIPFSYVTKSFPIVNYPQLVENKIPVGRCPEETVFLNKPLTFWQQYTWQIILGLMVIVTLIVIALLNIFFQRKQILFLNKHNNLVNNMPIGYTQATVLFSPDGQVTDIDYYGGNGSFQELIEKNALPDQPYKLFPVDYISNLTARLFESHCPVTFIYYFKQTDTYYEFLMCLVEKNNSKSPNPENGKGKDIDIFATDVTARSKAENELRKFAQKLDLTLNLARIIPWRWDLHEHKITCEAQRILRHLHFTPLRGSTHSVHIIEDHEYFERIHPEDVGYIKTVYQDLVEGRTAYAKAEFRIQSVKGGETHTDWIEVNAMVTEHDERQCPSVLSGSLLLITERKKQELALIAAREKACESDRMKSVFLANMSHEIRTPLNAIVGFSNMLGKTDDAEKKRKFMSIIENNNQLLLQLIGDVLDLAKIEANTLDFYYQSVDLNNLMRNIESSIRLRVKPGVMLNCILGLNECTLQTEPNRLSQVLINLLTNASKFTTVGNITFGYQLNGMELYFFVQDTGIGISAENQTRLFQRFSKLNDFAQGTGLGLSISRGIVEKMGGRIGCESDGEGKGSKFWFTIPYVPMVKEEQPVIEDKPKNVVKQEEITILVAEDNESNYLLFQSILESKYRLLHAWDGCEAVDLYKEHRPQVIIMDINMPNMDGYEATREIRKLSETVPIIAVTAYAFASDKKRILESGFNSYVSKPINADKLIQELKSIMGKTLIML